MTESARGDLGPGVASAQDGEAGPGGVIKAVAAQAGFVAALMFYAGAVYTDAYYAYFHVAAFALGFGFPVFVLQSLHLVTVPVISALVVVAVAAEWRRLLVLLRVPESVARPVQGVAERMARWYIVVVATGLVLLLQWQRIQPNGWIAPVTIAAGLLLGQTRAAHHGVRPTGLQDRALPLFVVGLLLVWTATLTSARLGREDAVHAANEVVRRTGVVLYSTRPLSLSGRGLQKDDLGDAFPFRYRYSGLRMLVEDGDRYFLLPVGWQADADAVYVIRETESTRVELMPGTQR